MYKQKKCVLINSFHYHLLKEGVCLVMIHLVTEYHYQVMLFPDEEIPNLNLFVCYQVNEEHLIDNDLRYLDEPLMKK